MQVNYLRSIRPYVTSDIKKQITPYMEVNIGSNYGNKRLRNNSFLTAAESSIQRWPYDKRSPLLTRYFCQQLHKELSSKQQPVRSFSQNWKPSQMSDTKKFSFYDYDIVGFDLDNTLLRYNLNEMLPLIYKSLCQYLVDVKKYPAILADQDFDPNFQQRGLVLDADNGNVLKLSNNATILRATHGTRLLTKDQIIEIYGIKCQWEVTTQFFHEPLSTWNGPLSEKLRTLLDYFDTPSSLAFAQSIDILDAQAKAQGADSPMPYKVWPDILDGLVQLYVRENFANGQSNYFNSLREKPDRYLMRASESALEWLKELRANGRALFLLTGSNIDFANFTASYALGDNWQELFDCVVCYAKKPGFFTMHRPFLQVDHLMEVKGSELSLNHTLPLQKTYSQGNWKQLQASFARKLGKTPDEIRTLYVGDNLIQDMYTPVKHGDLDAVVLCEELYADKNYSHMKYEFRDLVNSTFWGSYFCIDNQPTLWSAMIGDYSKLCVASIDELAKESISHRFICKNHHGFFPESPADLIVQHVNVG